MSLVPFSVFPLFEAIYGNYHHLIMMAIHGNLGSGEKNTIKQTSIKKGQAICIIWFHVSGYETKMFIHLKCVLVKSGAMHGFTLYTLLSPV